MPRVEVAAMSGNHRNNDDIMQLSQRDLDSLLMEQEEDGIEEPIGLTMRQMLYFIFDGGMLQLRGQRLPLMFSYLYQLLVVTCISTSVVGFIYETLPSRWGLTDDPVWVALEIFVVVVFTLDYLARFLLTPYPRFALPTSWRCHCIARLSPRAGDVLGRRTDTLTPTGFLWQFMNVVDLFSVLPYYIELMIPSSPSDGSEPQTFIFPMLRILRMFRLARLFHASKYIKMVDVVGRTFKKSTAGFVLMLFSVLCAGVIFGAMEFFAENLYACTFDTTDKVWYYTGTTDPSPYQSVVDAMWWAVVTLTTVGYGDKFPISWPGQLVATCTVLMGLVVLAFPITLFGANFADVVDALKEQDEIKQAARLAAQAKEAQQNISTDALVKLLQHQLQLQSKNIVEMQKRLKITESLALQLIERQKTMSPYRRRLAAEKPMRQTDVEMAEVFDDAPDESTTSESTSTTSESTSTTSESTSTTSESTETSGESTASETKS